MILDADDRTCILCKYWNTRTCSHRNDNGKTNMNFVQTKFGVPRCHWFRRM
jgi:hypothetical protein